MTDSKVILCDIFWHFCEILMYLPLALHRWHVWSYIHWSTQHLFRQQMFSASTAQRYDLPRTITVKPTLFVYWLTLKHICRSSKKLAAQTNVTLPAEMQRASCLLVQWKHAELPLIFFGRPMLWMLYFHSTMLGCVWTWSTPWSATSSHIFFLRMDNQFANKKFQGKFCALFCRHMTCV
jgi:hypothetical protein